MQLASPRSEVWEGTRKGAGPTGARCTDGQMPAVQRRSAPAHQACSLLSDATLRPLLLPDDEPSAISAGFTNGRPGLVSLALAARRCTHKGHQRTANPQNKEDLSVDNVHTPFGLTKQPPSTSPRPTNEPKSGSLVQVPKVMSCAASLPMKRCRPTTTYRTNQERNA